MPDRSQILPINDCSQSFFLYGLLGWARRGAYVGWDDHTVRLSWQLYNQLRDEGAFAAEPGRRTPADSVIATRSMFK